MDEANEDMLADAGDVMEEDDDSSDDDNDTSAVLNEQSWLQIKHNDPTLTSLIVDWADPFYLCPLVSEDGSHIGANTHVRKLTIDRGDHAENREYDMIRGSFEISFYRRGLASNESIEHIVLRNGTGDNGSICQFLENNPMLRRLEINHCRLSDVTSFMLASALSGRNKSGCESSLERVVLHDNQITDERDLAKIIAALETHVRTCTHLSLTSNNFLRYGFGRIGCVALGNLLRNSSSRIRVLDLMNSKFDDEGLGALSCLLASNNNTLEKLSLRQNKFVTATGWGAFSTFLQGPHSSSLKELDLGDNAIDDDGATSLAAALENNASLESLDLSSNARISDWGWRAFSSLSSLKFLDIAENGIEDEGLTMLGRVLADNTHLRGLNLGSSYAIDSAGWHSFFTMLSNSNSPLKELLVHTNNIDDAGVTALANWLENNKTLKLLNLSTNPGISSDGWRTFFRLLQNSNCKIENLCLSEVSIDNDTIVPLVASLGSMDSLKTLSFDSNGAITAEGWQTFSNLLRSPNCMLTKLSLDHNTLTNEAMTALANALIHNRILCVMHLDSFLLTLATITTGWVALSDTLCDKSSIDSTYSSNHILRELFEDSADEFYSLDDFTFLLQLNRDNTAAEAARLKILHYHFLHEGIVNVEYFVGMELKALPVAISWIGRDNVGFPVLYRLLQIMPYLLDCNAKVAELGLKRKRV